MAGNGYANSGISADNRSAESYENVYVNEDVLDTQVTRTNKETLTSVLKTSGSRCCRVTAVCVALLGVLLLTAVTVLWIKLITEKNLSKQLQQDKSELRNLSKRLQRERDELRNLTTQLQQEREETQDMVDDSDVQDQTRWTNFGSSLYYFSEMKNWTESRQDCRERGGDLAIIDSQDKQEFIAEQLRGSRAWIGLSVEGTEGEWTWVDGTPLTTGYWGANQPDDGDDKDCAEIGYTDVGDWNSRPCFYKQGWICDKSAESE